MTKLWETTCGASSMAGDFDICPTTCATRNLETDLWHILPKRLLRKHSPVPHAVGMLRRLRVIHTNQFDSGFCMPARAYRRAAGDGMTAARLLLTETGVCSQWQRRAVSRDTPMFKWNTTRLLQIVRSIHSRTCAAASPTQNGHD